MLETKISDLTVDEFRALIRDVVRQALDEMRNAGGLPLDDPKFPLVTYVRGSISDYALPVIRGTRIRVQTVAVAVNRHKEKPEEFAEDYGIGINQVREALGFYDAHKKEIDENIEYEENLERQHKEQRKKAGKK